MSTQSPNMKLTISTVNVDSGLNWELNLNNSLTIIDGHNHSYGSGVQINPSGININSALSFNNEQATALQAVLFTNQTSFSTVNALYVIGSELYYNDSTQAVQITSNGNVNATSSGISSGTASASFNAGVLVVNAASNTPANIQGGSILLGNNSSGSKFLTLSPPSAMGANYSLTLPNQPAANGTFLTINTSGVIGATVVVDNSTLQVSSNTLQVVAGGITSTQIAATTVTQSNMAIRSTGTATGLNGIAKSVTTGTFTSTAITPSYVTNLSVSVTTNGNPVQVFLQADQIGNAGYISAATTTGPSTTAYGYVLIYRNGSIVFATQLGNIAGGSTGVNVSVPPSSVLFMDEVSAGTYNYVVYTESGNSNTTMTFFNCVLVAYEIK